MKERPIIFSDEMVRAIPAGQKTQTRQVCKTQPELVNGMWQLTAPPGKPFRPKGGQVCSVLRTNMESDIATYLSSLPCPYGVPGDMLWVRESIRRKHLSWLDGATYLADLTPVMGRDQTNRVLLEWKWKRDVLSARFMPKWASRITLEITNVRVERLQNISEEDACAEGVETKERSYGVAYRDYRGEPGAWMSEARASFGTLWDRINAKRGYGWATNPWVWVIEFQDVSKRGAVG